EDGIRDRNVTGVQTCALPIYLTYRQTLRQTQRLKYQNDGRGQPLAAIWSVMNRVKLKTAVLRSQYTEALVQGELICMKNPWDLRSEERRVGKEWRCGVCTSDM